MIICVPYEDKYLSKVGRKTLVVCKHSVSGCNLVRWSLAMMTTSSIGASMDDVIGSHVGGEPAFIAISLQSRLT